VPEAENGCGTIGAYLTHLPSVGQFGC
jgi:hypothetical protein